MSLSPVKFEILEILLLNGKPIKAVQVASENKKEFPSTMMHLLGLTKMGYVASPQKGLYTLTDEGKKALGIQPATKETAKTIIAYAPHDKSFNFYVDVDKPLHMHAHSLQDFANKTVKVDIKSLEFHTGRGDFEAWFKSLGDQELAKKAAVIKEKKVSGEQLRAVLHNMVEQRCIELTKYTEQTAP
ncbi:MAG: hypothetical protein ACFCUE_09525 [Candidatus Bathyarchaeia archaeon]|jgi:hypothetical protein